MTQPLILVTNDDGIHAEGITALATAIEPLGEVWVVAPENAQSAQSHALTLHKPLRVKQLGDRRVSVSGTPTDSVFMAVLHLLPRSPDLVVSGINHGANVGDDVSYSGTASAALEGCIMGFPSIAFSHIDPRAPDFTDGAAYAADLARDVLKDGLPPRVYLNVNFPKCPQGDIRGVRVTDLGKRWYDDCIVPAKDPRGRSYYWIGGSGFHFEDIPGSDCNALTDGFISVTPISADLTARDHLDGLRARGIERT
jgi:5'-nucleotidase